MRHAIVTAPVLALALAACKPAADDVELAPAGPAPDPLSCPAERDPRFDALAEVVEAERVALGAPGIAVAVLLDGELAWCEGFGSRSPSDDDPMGPRTLMRIGSLTKVLTATALLHEADAGAITVDQTVKSVLGDDFELALSWYEDDGLTVEHLLTHQGGFYDYLEIDADRDDEALAEWVDGWLVDNLFLMSPPGAFYNYSNPNYMVAGRLVEAVSGELYAPHLTDRVLAPLGMERTLFRGKDVRDDGDYAIGDSYDWETYGPDRVEVHPGDYDNAWGRPAGYAWSSVEDLARFAAFLADGDDAVLSNASRLALAEPHVDMRSIPGVDHYGYGLIVEEGLFLDDGFHALRWISHGGAIPGFAAELHAVPEQGFALITLANTDGAYLRDALAEAFATFVDLPPPTAGPDLTPPDPADYVGRYDDVWNVGEWHFRLDPEGGLVMEMPLLDQYGIPYAPEVEPLFGDTFLIEVQGLPMDLTFVEEDGEPRWARTRYFVAERVAEPTGTTGSGTGGTTGSGTTGTTGSETSGSTTARRAAPSLPLGPAPADPPSRRLLERRVAAAADGR